VPKLALTGVGLWVSLEGSNAVWDQKQYIRDNSRPPWLDVPYGNGNCWPLHFTVTGTQYQVYYDIWANIHFGYVGRAAGFTLPALLNGAAVPIPWIAGEYDEVDDITVTIGSNLWDNYGPDGLTRDAIHAEILKMIPDMIEKQKLDSYSQKQKPTGACNKTFKHVLKNWTYIDP
jgi:hypothetical protein